MNTEIYTTENKINKLKTDLLICALKNCKIENKEYQKMLIENFLKIEKLIKKYKKNEDITEKYLLDKFFQMFINITESVSLSNNIKCFIKKCYNEYKIYYLYSIDFVLKMYDMYKSRISVNIDDDVSIIRKIIKDKKTSFKLEDFEKIRHSIINIFKKLYDKYNTMLVFLLKSNKDKFIKIIEIAFKKIKKEKYI